MRWLAGLLHPAVERLGDPVGEERVAPDVGEDDSGVALPDAEGEPPLRLPHPVRPEGGDGVGVEIDRAATLVRLRIVLVDRPAADRDALTPDGDAAGVEVDVVPSQAADLTAAGAGI